jgi:stringent starvation protein B
MARDPIHHPIQQAIEDIWEAGHTPRIQVDARRDDVSVPESVKARWGARLVLDLDAAWPLNLEYGADGIAVDLAFSGQVTRCTLPWEAIYVVLDRSTGRGVVVESHLPKDDAPADRSKPARPSGRPTPVGVVPPTPRPSTGATHESDGAKPPPAEAEPADAATSDEEAKRRRARFKVIDGGR